MDLKYEREGRVLTAMQGELNGGEI